MKITILFSIPSMGIQITSDIRWISANNPYLIEMGCDHIANARMWLNRKIKEHRELGYPEPVINGFSYSQWFTILTEEEKRRREKARQIEIKAIEEALRELNPQKYNKAKERELEARLRELLCE